MGTKVKITERLDKSEKTVDFYKSEKIVYLQYLQGIMLYIAYLYKSV